MNNEHEDDPQGGAAAFFSMLLGNALESRKRMDRLVDRITSPAIDVRLPMSLVMRLVDCVSCECDLCLGTMMWAKNLDTRQLDDELRRLLAISITNAELRLLADRQKAEYRRIYQHQT